MHFKSLVDYGTGGENNGVVSAVISNNGRRIDITWQVTTGDAYTNNHVYLDWYAAPGVTDIKIRMSAPTNQDASSSTWYDACPSDNRSSWTLVKNPSPYGIARDTSEAGVVYGWYHAAAGPGFDTFNMDEEFRACPRSQANFVKHWTYEIVEVNGVNAGPTPTPAPTSTRTPTPTGTVSPTATQTPDWTATPGTPAPDAGRCLAWDWKPSYPPAVDIGDVGGDDFLEPGECYEVIPGMNIQIPDLGAVGDLVGWEGAEVSWDAFGYCVTWVNLPALSIVGLSISMDWFLLPVVAWLLAKILEIGT